MKIGYVKVNLASKTVRLRKNEKVKDVYENGLKLIENEDYTINKNKLSVSIHAKDSQVIVVAERNI